MTKEISDMIIVICVKGEHDPLHNSEGIKQLLLHNKYTALINDDDDDDNEQTGSEGYFDDYTNDRPNKHKTTDNDRHKHNPNRRQRQRRRESNAVFLPEGSQHADELWDHGVSIENGTHMQRCHWAMSGYHVEVP